MVKQRRQDIIIFPSILKMYGSENKTAVTVNSD